MRNGLIALVAVGLCAGPALAQTPPPAPAAAADLLTARTAPAAFDQIATRTFLAPAVQALRTHYPEQYAAARAAFIQTATTEGSRAAARGVSGTVNGFVAANKKLIGKAPEAELNRLLVEHVETLRLLRDENPAACVAFAETLAPDRAPSDKAATQVMEEVGAIIAAVRAAQTAPKTYAKTAADDRLLSFGTEDPEVSNATPAGRCQGYLTLFGVTAAQAPGRSARIFSSLLLDAFDAANRPPPVPVISTPLRN